MKPLQVPTVEVDAASGSYNPTFENHQALLLWAHEMEVRKKRAGDKVERQLKIPKGTELPTADVVFQEQCEGLLEESGMRKMRRRQQSLGMRQTRPRGRRRQWSSSAGGRRKPEPWCEDGFGEDTHDGSGGVCGVCQVPDAVVPAGSPAVPGEAGAVLAAGAFPPVFAAAAGEAVGSRVAATTAGTFGQASGTRSPVWRCS